MSGWTYIGGDLEAKLDEYSSYVDIRTVGKKSSYLFISKKALENALALYPDEPEFPGHIDQLGLDIYHEETKDE